MACVLLPPQVRSLMPRPTTRSSSKRRAAQLTTVNLVASPATGLTVLIKDGKGDASSNNITITPNAGTIDGASNAVLATNYAAVMLIYNGTEWNIC